MYLDSKYRKMSNDKLDIVNVSSVFLRVLLGTPKFYQKLFQLTQKGSSAHNRLYQSIA